MSFFILHASLRKMHEHLKKQVRIAVSHLIPAGTHSKSRNKGVCNCKQYVTDIM